MFMNCVRIFLDVRTWIHIAFDLLMKSLTGTLVQFCAVIIDEWSSIGAHKLLCRLCIVLSCCMYKIYIQMMTICQICSSSSWELRFSCTNIIRKKKEKSQHRSCLVITYCRLGRRVSIVSYVDGRIFRRVDYFFLTSNLMVQNNRSTNLNEN